MFSLLRPHLGIQFYSKVSLCSFPAIPSQQWDFKMVLLLLLMVVGFFSPYEQNVRQTYEKGGEVIKLRPFFHFIEMTHDSIIEKR